MNNSPTIQQLKLKRNLIILPPPPINKRQRCSYNRNNIREDDIENKCSGNNTPKLQKNDSNNTTQGGILVDNNTTSSKNYTTNYSDVAVPALDDAQLHKLLMSLRYESAETGEQCPIEVGIVYNSLSIV